MILRIVNGFLRFFSSIFMSRKHRSRSCFFCDKSDVSLCLNHGSRKLFPIFSQYLIYIFFQLWYYTFTASPDLKRSRAPDKLACRGRRERLQQAAKPPSSAHFVSYAVAFFIAAKAAKNAQKRGTSGICYIHKPRALIYQTYLMEEE